MHCMHLNVLVNFLNILQAFDCEGKTGGKVFDGCGECGGDNTSCTIYQGIFDTAVSTGRQNVLLDKLKVML